MATKKSNVTSVPRMSAQDKRWQAQSDLRTIQEATQIQANKSRMTAAQKEAQTQMAALNSVTKKK